MYPPAASIAEPKALLIYNQNYGLDNLLSKLDHKQKGRPTWSGLLYSNIHTG